MEVLVGLDVGTTAIKALAFTGTGRVVASSTRPLALLATRPGWIEQDPEAIWQSTAAACKLLVSQLPAGATIRGISISTQGGTTIPVGADGMPTHAAFSWMDERAQAEALAAEQQLGKKWVYRTTGWTLYDGLPLNHIAWFGKHCPDAFSRTDRFCFVSDFILYRLCGEYVMDPSNASITQLYRLESGEWDEQLCAQAGIRSAQLSPVLPSGQVIGQITRQAGEQTGLPEGVSVVNGAHDQYCAATGTGVTQAGPTLLSCGTAWVALLIPHSLEQALDAGLQVSRHAVSGLWGGLASLGGVGSTVEWLIGQYWPEMSGRAEGYQAFTRAAAQSEAGAGGLVFHPLTGGHKEVGDLANRGIVGLTLHHTRGDLARALMEGIALELRWLLEDMECCIQVDRLKMIGGAAHSLLWPQIVADITRRPVELFENHEAASLGAALLAGVGAGFFADPAAAFRAIERPSRQLEPDPAVAQVYLQQYQHYHQIWDLLPHQSIVANRGESV